MMFSLTLKATFTISLFLIAPGAVAVEPTAPPVAATAPEKEKTLDPNIGGVICKLGSEERHLYLTAAADQADRFEVRYTKLGQDQSVGKLKSHESGVGIVRRISKNLEDGGWKCRDLKTVEVSSNPNDDQDSHE